MIRFISLGRDGIHITSVPCTTSCCPPGSPAKHRCRSSSCLRSSSAMAASFNFRWISSSFFFPYTSWWIYKGYIAKLKRHERCISDHFWTCAQGSNIWLGSSSGINFKSNCQWPNIWIVPDSWVATTIKPRPQIKTRPQCSYTSRILCVFQEDLHIQTNLIKSLITGSWSPSPTYFHIIRPFHKTTPTDPPNYQLPSLIIHYIRCSYNTYIYIYIYNHVQPTWRNHPGHPHQPINPWTTPRDSPVSARSFRSTNSYGRCIAPSEDGRPPSVALRLPFASGGSRGPPFRVPGRKLQTVNGWNPAGGNYWVTIG